VFSGPGWASGALINLPTLDVEAGKAFEEAAQIQTNNLKEPDDAANTLVDAFKAYRKDDPQAAVRCINVAIDRYTSRGNFRRAAGHKESVGEIYEQELSDPKNALDAYETAASWYEGDNANAYVPHLFRPTNVECDD
jgi:alpha-soluble NSF attachment protein